MALIEVKNLTKCYGKHLAVDNLSFTVEKGQIYGFLGPNGAGKSTTMNIMTGYLGATKGEVLIDGHDILKEPEEAKRCIGYLPEQPPLYLEMTVMEYLRFAAELKKIPKEDMEIQIEKAMRLTRLSDVRGRLISNLSKGYKQRVGLAQAILGFPEIIILDEPTVDVYKRQGGDRRQADERTGCGHRGHAGSRRVWICHGTPGCAWMRDDAGLQQGYLSYGSGDPEPETSEMFQREARVCDQFYEIYRSGASGIHGPLRCAHGR